MENKICPLLMEKNVPIIEGCHSNYDASCRKEKCEFYFYNACIVEHLFNMSVSLAIVASRA